MLKFLFTEIVRDVIAGKIKQCGEIYPIQSAAKCDWSYQHKDRPGKWIAFGEDYTEAQVGVDEVDSVFNFSRLFVGGICVLGFAGGYYYANKQEGESMRYEKLIQDV